MICRGENRPRTVSVDVRGGMRDFACLICRGAVFPRSNSSPVSGMRIMIYFGHRLRHADTYPIAETLRLEMVDNFEGENAGRTLA